MRIISILSIIIIIFSVIFFSLFKLSTKKQTEINQIPKEKSRVEQLVIGDTNYSHNKKEKEKTVQTTNINDSDNQSFQKTTTINKEELEPKLIDKDVQNENQDIETLLNEFSQKYNNNPNAEVTDEDVYEFMEKLFKLK